eukprot:260114_1
MAPAESDELAKALSVIDVNDTIHKDETSQTKESDADEEFEMITIRGDMVKDVYEKIKAGCAERHAERERRERERELMVQERERQHERERELMVQERERQHERERELM